MSMIWRAAKSVVLSLAVLASSTWAGGSAHGAILFEQGTNYHVIGYEAGALPDGSTVALVVMRVEIMWVSGQMKVLTTVEDVIIRDGWSYEIIKAGGVDSAVEIDLFNATCSGRFKALYKPGKTVIDVGEIRCR